VTNILEQSSQAPAGAQVGPPLHTLPLPPFLPSLPFPPRSHYPPAPLSLGGHVASDEDLGAELASVGGRGDAYDTTYRPPPAPPFPPRARVFILFSIYRAAHSEAM
jgi:hypothetical protein